MGFQTVKYRPKGICFKLIVILASLVPINCQASSLSSLGLRGAVCREPICLPGSWPHVFSVGGILKNDPVNTFPGQECSCRYPIIFKPSGKGKSNSKDLKIHALESPPGLLCSAGYEVCITIAEVRWKKIHVTVEDPLWLMGRIIARQKAGVWGPFVFSLRYLLLSDLKRALNSIPTSAASVISADRGRKASRESKGMALLLIPSVNLVTLAKA